MKVSPEIDSLVPYKPGKPISETQKEYGIEKVSKLASNENALGVPASVVKALSENLTELHRYPDPSCTHLRSVLSDQWQWPADQMLVGNGSNELIDLMIRVFCEPGDRIVIPQSSFIAYSICAQAARVRKEEIPLQSDLRVSMDQLCEWLKNERTPQDRLLFLANPNNPTGCYYTEKELRELIHVVRTLENFCLVIDDAYNEFVRAEDYPDSLSLARGEQNVAVLRTFSKVYGLAGMRVGALLGASEMLNYVHRVRNPFNVNSLAQAAVLAAVSDKEYIRQAQELVWAGLDYFYKELNQLGLDHIPSQANFVLIDTHRDPLICYDFLLRRGVILRPVKEYGLNTHLRMSVGLPEENAHAVEALAEMVREIPKL